MRRAVGPLLLGAIALAVVTSPATAQAPIVVNPGESIQAALDAAPPGSVIEVRAGTYEEAVVIAKSGITLRGAGIGQTILEVGGLSAERGIYAEGVDNLVIEDLTVRGFPVDEILIGNRDLEGSGGRGHIVRRTHTAGAGSYGIGVFQATDTRLEANEVTDNEIGLYIGRMPDCRCDIVGNRVFDNNSLGILVAAVGNIVVRENDVTGNNSGIFALLAEAGVRIVENEVSGNSQGIQIGATDGVAIYRNTIVDNNRPSTEPENHPAGYGVALWGAAGTRVVRNHIAGHEGAAIEAIAQDDWKGGTVSTNNNLCPNTFSENAVILKQDAASSANRLRCVHLPVGMANRR